MVSADPQILLLKLIEIPVSGDVHLRRNEKLFSSVIIQSGLLPLCGVLSEGQYQVIYDKLLAYLKIPTDLSPRKRLEKLLKFDEKTLTEAMMPVCITPVITFALCDDRCLIGDVKMPSYSDYGDFKAREWCPRIMIGDVANE